MAPVRAITVRWGPPGVKRLRTDTAGARSARPRGRTSHRTGGSPPAAGRALTGPAYSSRSGGDWRGYVSVDPRYFRPTEVATLLVAKRHTSYYDAAVKYFTWDGEKNEKLKAERGVSFEEIVFHIERVDVLDILEHPNRERYGGQRIFVVQREGYAYLVPFIEEKEQVVLETIIPSRKATREYLGEETADGEA